MRGFLEWLSKFFGSIDRGKVTADDSAEPFTSKAPSHIDETSPGVRHDPTLIPRLKEDHRSLLKQYATIKNAADDGHWAQVHADLLRFRADLTNHLLTESVKLYVYLRLKLASDAVQLRLMRNFSSEMVGIGKVVVDFIEANEDVALNPEKQGQFLDGWGEIGKVLGDRVGREEKTLYPMYEEPANDGKSHGSRAAHTAVH